MTKKSVSRRAQRLAYEQQRARAEADHRKYLEMSGKVGGPQASSSKPTYKLSMGSRKNVKKSDSGIIMDTSVLKLGCKFMCCAKTTIETWTFFANLCVHLK